MQSQDVFNFFGGQAATAKALTDAGFNITKQAVGRWGQLVPDLRAYQIEQITRGKEGAPRKK